MNKALHIPKGFIRSCAKVQKSTDAVVIIEATLGINVILHANFILDDLIDAYFVHFKMNKMYVITFMEEEEEREGDRGRREGEGGGEGKKRERSFKA